MLPSVALNLHCPLGACNTQRIPSGTERATGDRVVTNGKVGVVIADTPAAGNPVVILETDSQGITLPKAAVAVTELEDAYYDPAGDVFTNDGAVAGVVKCGYFAESAAAGAGEARLVLKLGL